MTLFSVALEGDKPLESYLGYAALLERYGFYSMQIYEHLPYRPAWAISLHVAGRTNRLKIGPVTVPVYLYDPVTLTRLVAALDELAAGRVVLGVSRGAYHELVGHVRDRSIEAVEETVEAVDLMLRTGKGGYRGRTIAIDEGLRLWWREAKKAEIYVGTSGPRLAYRAAAIKSVSGIVVDNLWNPRYASYLRERIEEGAKSARRDPGAIQMIARPFCYISRDKGEAEAGILPHLREYLPSLVGDSPMLRAAGISYSELLTLGERCSDELASRLVENFSAIGDADEIIEQTSRMVDAGARHICYGHPLGREVGEAIRLIGEKVKPYFEEMP